MNWTLRETLTKLAIETGGDWVTLLPFALFWERNTPYKLGLTPFEIVYGSPPPICSVFEGKTKPSLLLRMFQQEMLALSKVHKRIWSLIREVHEGQSKGMIPSHDMSGLLRPWGFPGKSTGVGCHCLLPFKAYIHIYIF